VNCQQNTAGGLEASIAWFASTRNSVPQIHVQRWLDGATQAERASEEKSAGALLKEPIVGGP
jgi:hypothetical protein